MAVVEGKLSMQQLGLCYAWEEWLLEDGTECAAGGVRRAPAMSSEELTAAVEVQGAEVRRLKEEAGLSNQDAEVKAAVSELLRLKSLLAEME